MDLNEILAEAIALGASDVHLKTGSVPVLRVSSRLARLDGAAPVSRQEMDALVETMLDRPRRDKLRDQLQVDFAYATPEAGRFRVNVFYERGQPAVALRSIPPNVRSIRELSLPRIIEKIALENRGLVLVTGTTGSGKSTTLAAMIRHVNESFADHVITIEDPIEYVHADLQSIINQREIGEDATSFAAALKGALRQDPDVILVGEMRDLETIETAILAAETGHLVMSTLHTLDATETITRVISTFPEHQRDQTRLILANVLKGIISQRLVPRADGTGMVPAVEVLVSTARIRECIAVKEKTIELADAIAQGHSTYGMQTFDQSLLALLNQKLITFEEAMRQATNPSDFALKVRGIGSTSDSRWEDFEATTGEAPEGAAGRTEDEEDGGLKIERF